MASFPDFKKVRYFISDPVDCSTVHTQSWGSDWPLLGATVAPLVMGARTLFVNISGTHAQNVQFTIGTNGSTDNLCISLNGVTAAAMAAMVATGGTKNFSLSQLANANNTALTGCTTAPTISINQACSVGAAVTVRFVFALALVPMA